MTYVTERMNAGSSFNLREMKKVLQSSADSIELYVMQNQDKVLRVTPQNSNCSSITLQEVFKLAKEFPDKKVNCYLKQEKLEFAVLSLARKMNLPNTLIYSGQVDLELIRKDKNQLPGVEVYADIERFFPAIYQAAKSTELETYFYDFLFYSLHQSKKYEISCIHINYTLCLEKVMYFMKLRQIRCSVYVGNARYLEPRLLAYPIYNITRNVQYQSH